MYAPDPIEKKFDFEHLDIKLYKALKALVAAVQREDRMPAGPVADAELAIEEFELHDGPIPEWAVARNWDYSLVAGAQLLTKDGRRTGNAHIVFVDLLDSSDQIVPETRFHCLTDAGSKFVFNERELEEAFTIGDWISDPLRILKDFDRDGHFTDLLSKS